MAIARWNDAPVLILSTNEDQMNGSSSENSVSAYQIIVQEKENAELSVPQASSKPETEEEAVQNSLNP
jgi:hypothetical protein